MKTRIAVRIEPSLGAPEAADTDAEGRADDESRPAFAGAAVIAARTPGASGSPGIVRSVEWLLARGVEEVLILPERAAAPRRVLIHWVNESARRATLAVSASLLRHVSAEAVYVGILPQDGPPDARRPLGMRVLLDARSEAQAVHGLDMRTELRYGDVARELAARLAESADQLLILGVTVAADLGSRFAALLAEPASPLLIVFRRAEAARESPQRAAAAPLVRFA
jgi:hypothetical protein